MNKPSPANLKRFRCNRRTVNAFFVGVLAMIIGCGDSETSDSVVVDPPDPGSVTSESATADDPPAASEAEAPGEIELPSGTIPEMNDSSAGEGSGGLEMPAGAQIPDSSSNATSSSVRYATWDAIEKEVKSTGKVTVVDLWSLSCEPCLKEFPGLVELHKKHGADIQCIAVDMDYDGRKSRPPSYYEERVVSFLKGVDAGEMTTFISETPSDDIYAATGLVSIPAVLVFDASGKLVKSFVDAGSSVGFTYESDVTPFVKQMLN